MTDKIDYRTLMHNAMRGLIKEVLLGVIKNGLPGNHHFFITIDTTHPELQIASWLKDRYPSDITVVMQHWYDGLDVQDDGFSVTLNFGDQPEPLYIPYDSILTFVDPSVEFGLRFESMETDDDLDDDQDEDETPNTETSTSAGEVVSLDSFRKP